MTTISYSGYRFPAEIIQHAVWIYLRFTLSYRDVEELLAERGIVVSHETVRRWVIAFGPRYARRLRAVRCKPNSDWHLDEMFVSIGGKRMYLWRAVDAEGEVLDILVQARRDQRAAQSLMRKLLRKFGMSLRLSSPTACLPMERLYPNLASPRSTSKVDERTIELRARTCQSDDETQGARV
jgi:putative transposase